MHLLSERVNIADGVGTPERQEQALNLRPETFWMTQGVLRLTQEPETTQQQLLVTQEQLETTQQQLETTQQRLKTTQQLVEE